MFLLRSPAAKSSPPAPRLLSALGLIALYFVLQLGLELLLKGLAWLLAYWLAPAQPAGLLAHWLGQADPVLLLISLSLVGAAAGMLALIHRLWPAGWREADPPGLGFVPARRRDYGLALLLALIVTLLGELATYLCTGGRAAEQAIEQLALRAGLPMQALFAMAAVSLGPLVEEVLFRGLLFGALWQRCKPWWALSISALLFAGVHLSGLYFQWYALPELTLLGLLLAWLRWRCHSLWPAVLAHGSHNLLAMIALLAAKPGS